MPATPETSMRGCMLRVFWSFAGPAFLAIVALVVATHKLPLGGLADYVFAAIAAAMIAARILEGTAPAVDEASSASQDVGAIRPRSYVILVLVFGAALLLGAHFVFGRFLA